MWITKYPSNVRFINLLAKVMRLGVFSLTPPKHSTAFGMILQFSKLLKLEYQGISLFVFLWEKTLRSSYWSSLHMGKCHSRSTSRSHSWSFIAFNLCKWPLFFVIYDSQTYANDLDKDLEKIHNWIFNGKWILTQNLLNKLKKSSLVVKQKKTTSFSLST